MAINNSLKNTQDIFYAINDAIYEYKQKPVFDIIDKLTIDDILSIKDKYSNNNIFLYTCDKINSSNEKYSLPIFHKILSKFTNAEKRKQLFNTVNSDGNNWLQIILYNLNSNKITSNYNSNNIKHILYSIKSYKDPNNFNSNNTRNTKITNIDLTNVNNINKNGDNVLFAVCNNPFFNDLIMYYLIPHIDNINYQNSRGRTILITAAYEHSNLELINRLLKYTEYKQDINVKLFDNDKTNILIELAEYKYKNTRSQLNIIQQRQLEILRSTAYNSNSNNENEGENEAKTNNSNKKIEEKPSLLEEIVTRLIEKRIDIKHKDKLGKDALTYSIENNNIDMFKILFNILIKSDREYLIKTITHSIDNNSASTNIIRYYNSKIPFQNAIKYTPHIFPNLTPITDIDVKYGIELEICVKLDKKCIGYDINTSDIIYSHRGGNRDGTIVPLSKEPKEWLDLINIYLYNYIKLRSQTNDTLKRLISKAVTKYQYIIISNTPKNKLYSYIYDLKDLQIIQLHEKRTIDYTKPIITTDVSVICGDYKYLEATHFINGFNDLNEKNIDAINNTFHIEFVTPILTATPIIGRNKTTYDLDSLKGLFELIGLDKKDCYISNKSQGLHVNLSLYDKKTNKPIKLFREFYKQEFFKAYINWEKEAYPKYRLHESSYAKPLHSFVTEETYNNNYSKILDNKYVSLHRKDDMGLIEVRLFASSNNNKEIISRSEEAIGLLYSSYERWYNSIKSSVYTNKQIKQKKPYRPNRNITSKPAEIHKGATKGLQTQRRNKERNRTKRIPRENNNNN